MAEQEERIMVIPLRASRKAPRSSRANRAVKAVKEHVVRHLKAKPERVWVDPKVNEILWARGKKNAPTKLRVKVIKFEDELVEVSLPEG